MTSCETTSVELLAGPFFLRGGMEVFIEPGSVAALDQAADLDRFHTQVHLKSDHTLTLTNEIKEVRDELEAAFQRLRESAAPR